MDVVQTALRASQFCDNESVAASQMFFAVVVLRRLVEILVSDRFPRQYDLTYADHG